MVEAVTEGLKSKLVDDARHWWRWWSMRFILLGGALEGELALFPDALKGYLPDAWTHRVAMFCFFAGALARLTKQQLPDREGCRGA